MCWLWNRVFPEAHSPGTEAQRPPALSPAIPNPFGGRSTTPSAIHPESGAFVGRSDPRKGGGAPSAFDQRIASRCGFRLNSKSGTRNSELHKACASNLIHGVANQRHPTTIFNLNFGFEPKTFVITRIFSKACEPVNLASRLPSSVVNGRIEKIYPTVPGCGRQFELFKRLGAPVRLDRRWPVVK